MLLACYSHKHISYRIRTIIRKAITSVKLPKIYYYIVIKVHNILRKVINISYP
uniref:hypothetical protein n=1 Tax=Wolbachia endosymbiont (group A) of Scambus nigricans TaxID=2954055 RepID=UPI003877FEE5